MSKKTYNPRYYSDSELKGKSGVYQIRNTVNNCIYIGSSINIYQRFKRHLNNLIKNKHENEHLQHAFNKYKKENFIFEIIEFCDPEVTLEAEQYWLDNFFGKNCYNINPNTSRLAFTDEIKLKMSRNHTDVSGEKNYFYGKHFIGELNPFYGKKHTEETKQKLSIIRKGRKLSLDHRRKISLNSAQAKKVIRLKDKKVYRSITECAKNNNIDYKVLSRQLHEFNDPHLAEFLFLDEYKKLEL